MQSVIHKKGYTNVGKWEVPPFHWNKIQLDHGTWVPFRPKIQKGAV